MDLQTIKNNYAQEQGYEDWDELATIMCYTDGYQMESYMNEICIRAQKVALENAAENIDSDYTFDYSSERNRYDEVASSITSPENLIL